MAPQIELLPQPWHLSGSNGTDELYQSIEANVLQGKDTLRVTYDLHGLNALPVDASAIIFDQSGWRFVSLFKLLDKMDWTESNCNSIVRLTN